MGFSLRHLLEQGLHDLGHVGSAVYHQFVPGQNQGRYQTSAPKPPPARAPSVQQANQSVARNTAANRSFLDKAFHFGPASYGEALGGFAQSAKNTVTTPIHAANLGVANITHNPTAAANERRIIGEQGANNWASPIVPFGKMVAGAVLSPVENRAEQNAANYADNQLQNAYQRFGPAGYNYAEQVKNQLLGEQQNAYLNQAGLTPTTNLVPKVAGQAAITAGTLATFGSLPGAKSAVSSAVRAGSSVEPKAVLDNYVNRLNPGMVARRVGVSPEAGFIAGPKATGFKEAANQGRTFTGKDNRIRFEVSDKGATINKSIVKSVNKDNMYSSDTNSFNLSDVLNHPKLYQQYPDYKNLQVSFNPKISSSVFHENGGTGWIEVGTKNGSMNTIKSRLFHEITHNTQLVEKFAKGGNPRNFPNYYEYKRLAAETEARAVQKRMNMSEAQIARKPFYKSYDVKLKDQTLGSRYPVVRPGVMSVGEGDKLTTRVLKDLRGRDMVSKQYILDATNRSDLKQAERELLRNVANHMPDKINVAEFTSRVKNELLPLQRTTFGLDRVNPETRVPGRPRFDKGISPRYENVTLPAPERGKIQNYSEHVYNSPVKTSAGDIHFRSSGPQAEIDQVNRRLGKLKNEGGYFGHTRVEDVPGNTRRVIEVQSDLYQKSGIQHELSDQIEFKDVDEAIYRLSNYGWDKSRIPGIIKEFNLTKENVMQIEERAKRKLSVDIGSRGIQALQALRDAAAKVPNKAFDQRVKEFARLQVYNNPTAHFRMAREEIRQAALDGKTKIQFPTGETAMKVEGLASQRNFMNRVGSSMRGFTTLNDIKPGNNVVDPGGRTWVITDNLGNGRFKAIPTSYLNQFIQRTYPDAEEYTSIFNKIKKTKQLPENIKETFNLQTNVDTNNPIYRFYEKDLGRYLKNNYDASLVKDKEGVTWWQVKIKPEHKGPVEAFNAPRKKVTLQYPDERMVNRLDQPIMRNSTVPKYVYHTTSNKNISSIAKDGLVPGKNPNWIGVTPGTYVWKYPNQIGPAEAFDQNVLGKTNAHAKLRINTEGLTKSDIKVDQDLPGSSFSINKKIPPQNIEIKKSGRWQSLKDYLSTPKNQAGFIRLPGKGQEPLKPKEPTTPKVVQKKIEISSKPIVSKEGQFISKVKASPNTPQFVKENIKGDYNIKLNKQTLDRAVQRINENPEDALHTILSKEYKPTVDNHATGMLLAERARKAGNYEQMNAILEKIGTEAHNPGQAIQILSLWSKNTPEGIVKYAQKIVRNAAEIGNLPKGTKLTDLQAKKYGKWSERINKMPDGRDKLLETAKMVKSIEELVPSSAGSKASSILYYAQLLNPKTAIRNVGGNLIFGALENVSDAVAAPLDAAISKLRGAPRTVYVPSPRQFKAGTKGGREAFQESLAGVNLSKTHGQFGAYGSKSAFRSKAGRIPGKALSVELSVPDRTFLESAEYQSLRNQLRAQGVPKKLLTVDNIWHAKFAKDANITITSDMLQRAAELGKYRTFQDDSIPARLFMGLRTSLNLKKDFGVGNFVMNYPKTPGNLLARGLDFSPAGYIKTVIEMTKPLYGKAKGIEKPFNQEAFVRSISRASVGTASLVGTGAALNKVGIITGRPEQDKDLSALQKKLGLGAYKINISALKRYVISGFDANSAKLKPGDMLVNYDWAQPASFALTMGANLNQSKASPKSAVKKLSATVGGSVSSVVDAMNSLAEQPVLQGIQNLTGKGQGIAQGIISVLSGAPSAFVPTALSQVNQLKDNTTPETYNPNPITQGINQAKAKVPGLSQRLPRRSDTFGANQERYQGGSNNWFNVFLNPAFVTHYNPDKVTSLPYDIYTRSGEKQQAPRIVDKSIQIDTNPTYDSNGKKTSTPETKYLTGAELAKYQKWVGQHTSDAFKKLADDPKFNALPDLEKAKKMSNIMSDINSAAKIVLFGDQGYGTDNYKPTKVDKNIRATLSGKIPDYTSKSTLSTPDTVKLYSAQLTHYKNTGDLKSWYSTANKQISALNGQLKDSSLTEVERLTIQNRIDSLKRQVSKYQGYGGFTKAKKGKKAKKSTFTVPNFASQSRKRRSLLSKATIKAPRKVAAAKKISSSPFAPKLAGIKVKKGLA